MYEPRRSLAVRVVAWWVSRAVRAIAITVSKSVSSCKHNLSGRDRRFRNGLLRMSDLVQISTTTGTREIAERIAVELVDLRLAACAQVSGPITSIYRWQGQVENSEEWLCTAKTAFQHLPAIQELFKRLHPYEVPELIATPLVGGSVAYLKWLSAQVAPAPSPPLPEA